MCEIKYTEDSISISDSLGEIVYWDKQEWVEDPTLVLSIAHACYLVGQGKNLRDYIKFLTLTKIK